MFPPKFRTSSFKTLFYWSVVALGAASCLFATFFLPVKRLDWGFAFLAAFTLCFGSRLVLRVPGSKLNLLMSDALVFLTFLWYGGQTAILLATVDALGFSLINKKKVSISSRTALFNVATMAGSTGGTFLAVEAFVYFNQSPLDYDNFFQFTSVLGLMALTQFFVNSGIISFYQLLKAGAKNWEKWTEKCLVGSVTYIFGAAIAGVVYKLIEYSSLFTFVIVSLVAGLLYLTYRSYLKELQKTIEQAEAAERQKAEVERLRAEEAEKHIEELSSHIAEQKRISEALRVSKERFRHAALHDALTGLPNRSFFTEQLKYLLDRFKIDSASGFCVLFIDLDRFKNVNDTLGHAFGDELLIMVGKRLENMVRKGDMVSRLGGDEFAIVLVNVNSPDDAIKFSHRIHDVLSQSYSLQGHPVFTTPSIGIAMSSTEYEQPDDILRDSDIAMYHAKERGEKCALFDRELRTRAVNIMRIESDLRGAIERDELRVFYQPIVSFETGRLAGFEALMRWQHAERGLVSPADFIPVAEDTGLIVPMTVWILRAACTQLSQWRWQSPLNRSLLVSVNLSGTHFTQPDLVEQVSQILEETGIEPHCLKLEITESAVMENANATARILTDLRTLGVRLSIDDFGTGYSSLSYLHQFPIDTLKVDRSFVMRIGSNGENSEIVQTIVTLAKNLEMEVIAEGVETVEQIEQLRALGCHYGQGYYFSKPQPAEEIEKLMKQQTNWLPQQVELIPSISAGNIVLVR